MFAFFDFFFFLFFIVFFVIFFTILIKGITQWSKNNHSPRLTVPVRIVSKREDVTHHHHHGANDMVHTSYSTTYYVTFEVESGDRMELIVPSSEYGYMIEGDHGDLTFQGTRFLEFKRNFS